MSVLDRDVWDVKQIKRCPYCNSDVSDDNVCPNHGPVNPKVLGMHPHKATPKGKQTPDEVYLVEDPYGNQAVTAAKLDDLHDDKIKEKKHPELEEYPPLEEYETEEIKNLKDDKKTKKEVVPTDPLTCEEVDPADEEAWKFLCGDE